LSFKLLIFDCDGVLVDSEPVANRIFTSALNRIGLGMTYQDVCREFTGLSMTTCIERIEGRLRRSVPEGFVDALQVETFAAFRSDLKAIPGIVNLLDELEIPSCVATSGEPEKAELTLGVTGLLERFRGRIFSSLQVTRGKPAPDLFLFAADAMNTLPADCAVIEDSLPGVQAACAAGMTVFGFVPESDGADLAAAGARVFTQMSQLRALLQ
jgi:HAD superfamily hydrolase (TIGR01509 family)